MEPNTNQNPQENLEPTPNPQFNAAPGPSPQPPLPPVPAPEPASSSVAPLSAQPITAPAPAPEPPSPPASTTVIPPQASSAASPTNVTPNSNPNPTPVVMVGGDFAPDPGPPIEVNNPAKPVVGGPNRWKSKKMLIVLAIPFLLVGGASAFYFGYYMNPNLIYSQSMSNTGKGYDKLISYIDAQSKAGKRSYTGDGKYSYKSGGFSSDGKLAFKSDSNNGVLTFDVGASGMRVNAEIRTFKSSANTPDVYIKASGIKGLGGFSGSPEIDAAVNKLDNTWIFVDHTLIDGALNQGGNNEQAGPSREEIMDAARGFGRVNQEYVFTTDKDKAVTTIVKKHGTETAEGQKAYRYTISLKKENVKKYIDAQRQALKVSKMGAWLKKNNYDKDVYRSFDDAKKSADKIKSSDTFDIYMDVSRRIIYKVRLPDNKDPANNYADIGLDYKGGDRYPFFVSGKSKSSDEQTTGRFSITLDTSTDAIEFKANLKGNGSTGVLSASFNYRPTTQKITIQKPAAARNLSEVLQELGLGGALNQSPATLPNTGSLQGGIDSQQNFDVRALHRLFN